MYFSGTQGELYIDGVKAAKVRNWSFSSSLGLLDTTTLGDTDSTSTPGIRTNTGSCQLFYYSPTGVPGQDNSASTLINKLLKAGAEGVAPEAEEVVLKLAVTEGGGSTSYVQGPAYLTSVSMSCAVGEVLSADVSFQINGAFTEVVM
jgi:hypothetical protein